MTNITIAAFNKITIAMIIFSEEDLNNSPWIEGMYFLAAIIYVITIVVYWVLRRR